MRHQPLNQNTTFNAWPPFDPGRFIDMNPGFVRRNAHEAWSVFCRYGARPEPGRGSIWTVQVDAAMEPCGVPTLIIDNGIDPRAIMLGDRILVFFTVIERDELAQITGSSVAFAEYDVAGGQWTYIRGLQLPKNPISGPLRPNATANWEKNWVPFPIDDARVGLIYSHDPWNIITLNLDPKDSPRLEALFQGPAVSWDYGTIRGGTPPCRYDDGHLITFYHSSQVVGGKTVYSVGACVFRAEEPFTPTLQTVEPLLIAPYKSGVQRFGWAFSGSVIFPLGAERIQGAYRLLCGRDDGEIVSFTVSDEGLNARLSPWTAAARGVFHDYKGHQSLPLTAGGLLYVPEPVPGISELAMINFLKIIAGTGRTFVDVGAHIGFYTMALASGYNAVVSHEPSRFQHHWLLFNKGLNGFDHVTCRASALGDTSGNLTLSVLSTDGGGNTLSPEVVAAHAASQPILDSYTVPVEVLDDHGMADVDLLKIDVEGFELPVLRGAVKTINTSRPVIVIEVWVDEDRRRAVAEFMSGIDYTFEAIFPRTPELVLCLPRERRNAYEWFV